MGFKFHVGGLVNFSYSTSKRNLFWKDSIQVRRTRTLWKWAQMEDTQSWISRKARFDSFIIIWNSTLSSTPNIVSGKRIPRKRKSRSHSIHFDIIMIWRRLQLKIYVCCTIENIYFALFYIRISKHHIITKNLNLYSIISWLVY